MSKELLTNYIDAVISDDSETRRVVFGQYLENKTKELLGFKFVEPQGEPTTIVGIPSAAVNESIKAYLNEVQLTNEIDLDGNSVLVNGKAVGRLEERKISADSIDGDLYFVGLDGTTSQIKDNEFADLIKVITYKYLNK